RALATLFPYTTLFRSYRYQAVRDEDGELVGFCTFGEDARVAGYIYPDDALDIGVGMRPDLVGRGLGLAFTREVLDFARRELAPRSEEHTSELQSRSDL